MSSDLKKRPTETQPTTPQTQSSLQISSSQPVTQTQRLPTDVTFQNAAKLSITEDKPIMLDYWADSLDGKALIGVRENNEKMLVKSAEEYTSPIAKLYRSGSEYIVMTENSIYLVSSTIPSRRIA
jgi:hypothetical protein